MESPFANYLARALEDEVYAPPLPDIRIKGFQVQENHNLIFGINSISTRKGSRYAIHFPKIDASLEEVTLTYRGLLAEDIGRAAFTEFIRRKKAVLGLRHGTNDPFVTIRGESWIKGTSGAGVQEPFRTSKRFAAHNQGRYNVVITQGDNLVAEYDGVFQYRLGRKKGLVLFEAKSAGLRDIDPTSQRGRQRVQYRMIEPIKELYPRHILDVCIAAPPESIFQSMKTRQVREVPRRIHTYFNQRGIGTLFFPLPLSMEQLRTRARWRARLNQKHLRDEIKLPTLENQYWARTKQEELVLVKGQRVELILAREGEVYVPVYDRIGYWPEKAHV